MKDLQVLLHVPGLVVKNGELLAELEGEERFRRRGYMSLVREGATMLPDEFERWIKKPASDQVHPRFADGATVWIVLLLCNDREGYCPPVLLRLGQALRDEWKRYDALRLAIVTCGRRPLHPKHLLLGDPRVCTVHSNNQTLSAAFHVLRPLIAAS